MKAKYIIALQVCLCLFLWTLAVVFSGMPELQKIYMSLGCASASGAILWELVRDKQKES